MPMIPEHQHPRLLEFAQRIITQRSTANVLTTWNMINFDKQPAGLKLTSGSGERTFIEVTFRFNGIFADRYFSVPVTADVDVNNVILKELYKPFEGETEYSWRDSMTQNMFSYPESAKYFFEMYDSAKYDFTEITDKVPWQAILKGTSTPTEVIAKVKEACQTTIDTLYNVD